MFASSFSPDDIFIYNQVKALSEEGIEVRVLQPIPWAPWFLRWRGKWRRYYEISKETSWNGIDVRRVTFPQLPTTALLPLSSVLLVVPLVLALRKVRQTFDFQVIHAHCLTPDGFASVIAGSILSKPVILSARGSDVHTFPNRGAIARKAACFALKHCDRVTAVSRKLAVLANELVMLDDPVEVVYNGVDANQFAPCLNKSIARRVLGLPFTGSIFIYVGALIQQKGIEELIRVMELVGRDMPQTRLIAIGDGMMRHKLKELGKRLKGVDRVILPGVVPNEKVAEYMRAADILIHPSHAEGLPNVVLEAMASGLPVIATRVGGIPEAVVHGKTGLLSEAKDAATLEKNLLIVLNNRDQADRMGKAGQDRIVSQFSWKRNACEYIRIYQDVLEKR